MDKMNIILVCMILTVMVLWEFALCYSYHFGSTMMWIKAAVLTIKDCIGEVYA